MRRAGVLVGLAAILVMATVPWAPNASGAVAEDSSLGAAFARVGFTEHDSEQIVAMSWTVDEAVIFKFAADLVPPTISPEEAPWAVPARIGVTWVVWPEDVGAPMFPVEPGVVDETLYLPHGGPQTGVEYTVMWAQMGGPVDIAEEMSLFQNWSFPFSLPGHPVWEPLDQFPYDTWGGASIIPYITYGPGPWSLDLSVVGPDGSLQDTDFNGFGLIHGDTIIVGVETATLYPDGYEGATYGFAGHIHDGAFGSTESSRSLVSFATGLPGTFVDVPVGDTLVVGSEPPPPSTTTTTLAPTTTAPSASPTTAAPAADAGDEAGGLAWIFWVLILAGLALAFFGGRMFIAAKKGPCEELREAWDRARRECERARAEEEKARAKCEEATKTREDLDRRHRGICREWPPACEGEGAYVEESGTPGSRITQGDLHARRVALGRLWDDYQAGNVSAQQVEDAWDRANTPEFREEMRKKTAEKRAEREQLGKDLERAREAEKEACERHAEAKQAADDACAAAEEAKAAYDECVKEENAEAFVDAFMGLGPGDEADGEDAEEASGPGSAAAAQTETPVATTTTEPEDPLAGRKVGVPVPFVLDKTGLSGSELERAEKLETVFSRSKGTCDIAGVALDLWQFDNWHEETFGEPWFTWSAEGGNPNSVTATSGRTDTFMLTRVMACYEFVHFCAYICSDQLTRQRIGGDDDEERLLDEYSVMWGFPDQISTNTSPIGDEGAERGSIVTGVFRWGDYNNRAGYYHVGISIGKGKIVSLSSDGLQVDDTTGTVGGLFPSSGYSEVNVGDYRYTNTNPAPASKQ